MEIERKFLISSLPPLDSCPFHVLEQGYLSTVGTFKRRGKCTNGVGALW